MILLIKLTFNFNKIITFSVMEELENHFFTGQP